MFKSKVCGTVQEVIFPDFPDDDNTVTTTVTKSRRVSFGTNIIKEFIVGSAVSAQCVSEYEQAVSSSDSSNPNSSMSAVGSDILDHNPSFLPETSTIPPIPKPDFESSEYPKPAKFSRTICFSADSPTADMEFTEGCITLAKSILDKKNKEMTVIIQAKSKEPKDDDRSKREDVTKFFEGSQLEMSMTRCLKSKENKREERRFDSDKTRIFNKFDDEMSITRCDNVLKMRQSKIPDESDFMTEDSKENRMPLDLIMRQLDRDDSDSDLFNPEKSFNDFLNAASFESEKLNLNESMDISREFHQVAVETSRERVSFEKTQEHVLANFSSSDEFDAVIFKSQPQENDQGTPVFQGSLDLVRDMSMEIESQENLDKRNITNLLHEQTHGEEFFRECMDLRKNADSTAVEEMEIETNEGKESEKYEENEIREMEVEPNTERELSIYEENEIQQTREMEIETHEEMETSMIKESEKNEEKAPEQEMEANVEDEKTVEKNFEKEIETSMEKEKEIDKNVDKDLERHMEKKTEVNEEIEANLEKEIEQNMQKKINQTLEVEMELNMENEIQKKMVKELETNAKEDNEASVQKEKEMEKNLEKEVERNIETEIQENTEKKANSEKKIEQNMQKKVNLTMEVDIEVNMEKEIERNMENEIEPDVEKKMQTSRETEIEESVQKETHMNVGREIETNLEEELEKNAEKETNLVEEIETNKEIIQTNLEKVTERNDEMQMDTTMEEEIQKTKENEVKTCLEMEKTKNAEKNTEKTQEQINQTIPEEHMQGSDLSAEENSEEFETFEQSQTEHLLVDVKVVENLEEQSKESNCIWTLHDVRYPRSKKLGLLSFNCTLLQSPTILEFTLKKAKEESIDSCSVITASDIYLKEDTTLRHPEYDLVLSFGFKKQEEYFNERKRKITTVRHIPYFLDEINSFVRKLNSYLLQVYEILISYPGSDLKGAVLSFRLFSYPMFFSSTVSVDLTHLFRLSDSSLSLKHEIGTRNADEKMIRKIFQDCLKHKNCLCEFVIRSNQFLFELERGTGYVSRRSHIRLLPAVLRV